MQLDIPCLLNAGGVPAEVITAARGARKLELDIHVLSPDGHPDSIIVIDNVCVIGAGVDGINWNHDDGIVPIEYHED